MPIFYYPAIGSGSGSGSEWTRTGANLLYPNDAAISTVAIGGTTNPDNDTLYVAGTFRAFLKDFLIINSDNYAGWPAEQIAGAVHNTPATTRYEFAGTWSDAGIFYGGAGVKDTGTGIFCGAFGLFNAGNYSAGLIYENAGIGAGVTVTNANTLVASANDASGSGYMEINAAVGIEISFEDVVTPANNTIFTMTDVVISAEINNAIQPMRFRMDATLGFVFGFNNLAHISLVPVGVGGMKINTAPNVLPSYADDAAAGVGGLVQGDLYQTSGAGAAPLNVAGIVMCKQ